MKNPLKVIAEDLKFFVFLLKVAFMSDDSQKSPFAEREKILKHLECEGEDFKKRYFYRKNEYRASLEKDHEPEEIEEQMMFADKMIRQKAKLDVWFARDNSLDDIVSVAKHKQQVRANSEVLRNFDKLDEPSQTAVRNTLSRCALYVISIVCLALALVKVVICH